MRQARELADEHGWFLSRQFENEANPAFHAATTGPEIVADFEGRQLDYWVTGYGTLHWRLPNQKSIFRNSRFAHTRARTRTPTVLGSTLMFQVITTDNSRVLCTAGIHTHTRGGGALDLLSGVC